MVAAVLLSAACSDDDDSTATSASAEPAAATTATVAPATTAPPVVTVPATTVAATTVATAAAPPSSESTAVPSTVLAAPVATAAPQCATLAGGLTETTLNAGGVEHAVRIYVPSSFAGSPLPVVIDWHGLGSTGTRQAMYSDYETVAEEEGFIVVHPTGVADTPGGASSWQLFATPALQRDDLAFAGALIDELTANWCADRARVYSTGMSNGGFFTARLICEMADRIAAAVSVAGTYHPESCDPARDVPYLAIHGTQDAVVPFLGGESVLDAGGSDADVRVFFEQVMPAEFAEFAADTGCDATTVDTNVGNDVIQHAYTGCDGDTPMIFDEVRGGGHTWPSSPLSRFTEGALGYTTHDIDATRDGWAFMSQFTRTGS